MRQTLPKAPGMDREVLAQAVQERVIDLLKPEARAVYELYAANTAMRNAFACLLGDNKEGLLDTFIGLKEEHQTAALSLVPAYVKQSRPPEEKLASRLFNLERVLKGLVGFLRLTPAKRDEILELECGARFHRVLGCQSSAGQASRSNGLKFAAPVVAVQPKLRPHAVVSSSESDGLLNGLVPPNGVVHSGYGSLNGDPAEPSPAKKEPAKKAASKPAEPQDDCCYIVGVSIMCVIGLGAGFILSEALGLSKNSGAQTGLVIGGALLFGMAGLFGPSAVRKCRSASLFQPAAPVKYITLTGGAEVANDGNDSDSDSDTSVDSAELGAYDPRGR